jgi:glucose/arabinose dehydrogenase
MQIFKLGAAFLAAVATGVVDAQDLRPSPGLPELPQVYETSDYSIRVVEVAGGLSNPWSMAFLPNGDMLITERSGSLRIVRNGVLDPDPISGVPQVHTTILGGLLQVLLHPDFESNRTIYLSYAKRLDADGGSTTAVSRARLGAKALENVEEIFVARMRSTSPTNFGGRMAFGNDGHLYLTVGERQEQDRAQDMMDHGGKVLRLNDDGTAPEDNPFSNRDGHLPEIYTYGHRSIQGLAVHPTTGALWENEHGPLGGDELNILVPGANYGWPLVSFGTDYDGTQITSSGLTTLPGLEPPFMYWVPSIAISGLSFYTGDAFPEWRGNALVGSMMSGRMRWTGHVQRLTFNEEGHSINREPLLGQLRQRIRDIQSGPDGLIYVLTDQNPGVLLRIEPADR